MKIEDIYKIKGEKREFTYHTIWLLYFQNNCQCFVLLRQRTSRHQELTKKGVTANKPFKANACVKPYYLHLDFFVHL